MTGKRALTFPIGKVAIDGTSTISGTVAVSSVAAGDNNIGNVDIVTLPTLATPFADASTNASTSSPGGAALASHAFSYLFTITNTHASQFLYLLADASGTTTRYIDVIAPGETRRFPGVGNTSSFRLIGSGASTGYLLAGY